MKLTFSQLLALLFIALKLTDHINWSWGWALSPLWISLSLQFIMTYKKRKSKEESKESKFNKKLKNLMDKAEQQGKS
ncbi:hypothetical protein [Aquimarina macrocephali]|uniref:hypothetical protein n=1 Tax=Aquimarina macrocephali TaxID=666563 RepID=UPI003F675314